jgi:hypothetical protein
MKKILGRKIYKKAEDAVKNWLIYSLLFSTGVLAFTTKIYYESSKRLNSDIKTITTLRDKSSEYQRVIISNNQEEIKALSEELLGKDKKVKEVLALFKNTSKIKIVNKEIFYTDSFNYYDTCFINQNLDSFIKVPKVAELKDSSINIKITINKHNVVIDSLQINDTTVISVEKYKKNFFKTEYRIRTKNTSPYMINKEQEVFIYQEKKIMPKLLGVGSLILLISLVL